LGALLVAFRRPKFGPVEGKNFSLREPTDRMGRRARCRYFWPLFNPNNPMSYNCPAGGFWPD